MICQSQRLTLNIHLDPNRLFMSMCCTTTSTSLGGRVAIIYALTLFLSEELSVGEGEGPGSVAGMGGKGDNAKGQGNWMRRGIGMG
jgi:hypothetical protein